MHRIPISEWRIPRAGSRARRIYDEYAGGTTRPRDIAKAVGCTINQVQVSIWRMRHPDLWRERHAREQRVYMARIRAAAARATPLSPSILEESQ